MIDKIIKWFNSKLNKRYFFLISYYFLLDTSRTGYGKYNIISNHPFINEEFTIKDLIAVHTNKNNETVTSIVILNIVKLSKKQYLIWNYSKLASV